MAESVVSYVIERAGDLLIQEAQFLGAVVFIQVEQMLKELKRMRLFLKDADKRQGEEEIVRGWVSETRELAYDAEIVIDTLAIEIAARREKGISNKLKKYASIFIEGAKLHMLGKEIEVIKGNITDITNTLQTYGMKVEDEGEGSSALKLQQHQRLRRSVSYYVEDQTVGLTNDTQVLLEQLIGNNEHKNRKAISICGMGGLGKTTLAKKIYHNNLVRRHFDEFAWICVSQTFKTREVLEAVLVKLSSLPEQKEKISSMSDDELAKELNLVQQENKCLIILDDIWTGDDWSALQHAFPIEKINGMIVLTTRNKALGLRVDPNCFIHESQALSEEQSWELFQMKAFLRMDYEDIAEMENLGRKMVNGCAGLPLAIIVLSGLLTTKHSLREWTSVNDTIGMYLRSGGDKEYSYVQAVLATSYFELPYHLKSCFLYLGQFLEDSLIPVKKLFLCWVAEGFVVKHHYVVTGEKTLEDIAECYLDELIDRCIVQIGEVGSSGTVKTIRIHDLVRELCLSNAIQENFLEIVHANPENSTLIGPRVHRVFVVDSRRLEDFDISFADNSRLISLVGLGDFGSSIVSDFKFLRILSLTSCWLPTKWIKEIGKLAHLRYLSLDHCGIDYLPSSLGNLRNLQTFIVKDIGEVKIPNVIWKCEELRHLHFSWYQIKDERRLKLGNWRNMQTLRATDFLLDVVKLEKFLNLKKLEIFFDHERTKLLESSCLDRLVTLYLRFLDDLYEAELKKLILSCGRLQKLKMHGVIEKLPEHQYFGSKLTKITLIASILNEDPMPTLEKLPKLTFLNLYYTFTGNMMVCSSKGFPRLETLILDNLEYLVEWRVDEGAMASLCHLRIVSCNKLLMVPDGIKFINTLSQLEIKNMYTDFTNRVRVIRGVEGEDYHKVRHVSSIIFS